MRLQTKIQLSKLTFSLLTFVVFVFLLGIFVLVLCTGLKINPFQQATSSFLIASFFGLIGVVAVLVLFNVATSINLIAEAKIAELDKDAPSNRLADDGTSAQARASAHRRSLKKWGLVFLATAFLLVGIIFAGTYVSKQRYLAVVRSQANEVLQQNGDLLEKAGALLTSDKPADFKELYNIRTFLEQQRRDLPRLTIIYAGKFDNKLALYEIGGSFQGNLEKNTYSPQYFKCTKGLDCEYLKRFFSGENVDSLQHFTFRDDQFYIYIPHTGNGSRFVLLFSRQNSYGKFGS
ncbi:MAG: hypothetical protein ACP59X_03115 [Solidesulfovibrio sp. DCME]|uniref:hypothetical protein n=1 Tax=Solidesulfovibrio sp. DCME TaxID=3447380 RepID=UPI003D144D8B